MLTRPNTELLFGENVLPEGQLVRPLMFLEQTWEDQDGQEGVSGIWDKIKDTAGGVYDAVKDNAGGAYDAIKDNAGGAYDWTKDKLGLGGGGGGGSAPAGVTYDTLAANCTAHKGVKQISKDPKTGAYQVLCKDDQIFLVQPDGSTQDLGNAGGFGKTGETLGDMTQDTSSGSSNSSSSSGSSSTPLIVGAVALAAAAGLFVILRLHPHLSFEEESVLSRHVSSSTGPVDNSRVRQFLDELIRIRDLFLDQRSDWLEVRNRWVHASDAILRYEDKYSVLVHNDYKRIEQEALEAMLLHPGLDLEKFWHDHGLYWASNSYSPLSDAHKRMIILQKNPMIPIWFDLWKHDFQVVVAKTTLHSLKSGMFSYSLTRLQDQEDHRTLFDILSEELGNMGISSLVPMRFLNAKENEKIFKNVSANTFFEAKVTDAIKSGSGLRVAALSDRIAAIVGGDYRAEHLYRWMMD